MMLWHIWFKRIIFGIERLKLIPMFNFSFVKGIKITNRITIQLYSGITIPFTLRNGQKIFILDHISKNILDFKINRDILSI